MNRKVRKLNLGKNYSFMAESNESINNIEIAYETYGNLNKQKNNAILVHHALTGSAHVSGIEPKSKENGWWGPLIGPGKPIDTDKYFVICSNVLGSCYGTTGPKSINPKTQKPYGKNFPEITIRDIVKLQKILIDHLKIQKLKGVIGGSLGGMQSLEWAVTYPEMVDSVICIAANEKLSPFAIAYNYLGIQAIENDREENSKSGLALARMIGTLTYKGPELFEKRFGRKVNDESGLYQIENYLKYNGDKFPERFDANSYVTLSKAMNSHDISTPYGSMEKAFKRIKAPVLVIGISSDIVYFPDDLKKMTKKINLSGGLAFYREIVSDNGHDSFLVDFDILGPEVSSFLNSKGGFRNDYPQGF